MQLDVDLDQYVIDPRHPLVISRPGLKGGLPVIRGTGISVWVIVANANEGRSLDYIVRNYPGGGDEGVRAALAYYADHRDEIDRQIAEITADVDVAASDDPPSWLDGLREQYRDLKVGPDGRYLPPDAP